MLTQLVFVTILIAVSVKALVFGPSLGAFFGSGFCIKRCHRQLVLPLESAPFPPSGNVGKHLVWPGGPVKKDAIPARAPSTNSFINFVWEGREWTNKRKHERWMAPFNAETGTKNTSQIRTQNASLNGQDAHRQTHAATYTRTRGMRTN